MSTVSHFQMNIQAPSLSLSHSHLFVAYIHFWELFCLANFFQDISRCEDTLSSMRAMQGQASSPQLQQDIARLEKEIELYSQEKLCYEAQILRVWLISISSWLYAFVSYKYSSSRLTALICSYLGFGWFFYYGVVLNHFYLIRMVGFFNMHYPSTG